MSQIIIDYDHNIVVISSMCSFIHAVISAQGEQQQEHEQ